MSNTVVTNTQAELNNKTILTAETTAVVSGGLTPASDAVVVGFVRRIAASLTDAQIKALPTTGIAVVPAPGSGQRNRILGGTLTSSIVTPYTNVDATYADLHTETNSGANYMTYGPVNDSSVSLTQLAQLLTADTVYDLISPQLIYNSGYVLPTDPYGTGDQDNQVLYLKADNNGAGDFTGGNAANTLKVTVYYVVEAL